MQNGCIINGVANNPDQKPVEVVMGIAKKIGANISECDIVDAYFTKKNKNTNGTVVVKFKNKTSKITLLKEKKKLREIEDTKTVYINDFLSKENVELLKHAKALKTVGFKFIYHAGGCIYAKRDVKLKPLRIRSMDEVDSLLINAAAGVSKRKSFRATLDLDENDEDDDLIDEDIEDNVSEENFKSPL